MKKILIKKSSYGIVLIVVFALLSFFFRPTSILDTVEEGNAIITAIELKREYNIALKSPSRGYNDYYEITFNNSDNKYKCYAIEDIKNYGVNNIINKEVKYQSFTHSEYAVLRNIRIDERAIVKTRDIGYFPFLFFLGIVIISSIWSIWGFYISYLVPDEKRKKILGE
ncbi:MAG: hypothetical protein MI739_06520 [Bacteroidales bacterium]|nr:hypothetical protein [Bacteroidales bacterium]